MARDAWNNLATTTGPDPDSGGGASTRLRSKIFDRSRTCPTTSLGCSDHFSTSGRKISTPVENVRLGSNHRSTVVEQFDWGRSHRSKISTGFGPPLSVVPIVFRPVAGKFRLQSKMFDWGRTTVRPPLENFDRRSTVVENFDPSRT
ncbi:hypothetical protein TorRG33x02_335710 [Trema orientale]|uniref:Uncharacterized protein n=1 Tax=Trema orientale TaxID=63057 RepID=A0A2P5B139_TREOI|nr:hypothetical protein TorRG33x02_335710 [Trema orientale]